MECPRKEIALRRRALSRNLGGVVKLGHYPQGKEIRKQDGQDRRYPGWKGYRNPGREPEGKVRPGPPQGRQDAFQTPVIQHQRVTAGEQDFFHLRMLPEISADGLQFLVRHGPGGMTGKMSSETVAAIHRAAVVYQKKRPVPVPPNEPGNRGMIGFMEVIGGFMGQGNKLCLCGYALPADRIGRVRRYQRKVVLRGGKGHAFPGPGVAEKSLLFFLERKPFFQSMRVPDGGREVRLPLIVSAIVGILEA